MKSLQSVVSRFLLVTSLIFFTISGLVVSNVNIERVPAVVLFAPPAMIHDSDMFYVFPLLDIMSSIDDWNKFFDQVDRQSNVVIILNGPGGWVVVLDQVRLRIAEAKENGVRMRVVVTSFAASADALAICEFDDAQISPYARIMFHTIFGPDGPVIDDAQFQTCVDKGYITKEEVQKMNQGYEVWVTYDAEGNRSVEFQPDRRLSPKKSSEIEITQFA